MQSKGCEWTVSNISNLIWSHWLTGFYMRWPSFVLSGKVPKSDQSISRKSMNAMGKFCRSQFLLHFLRLYTIKLGESTEYLYPPA